MKKEKIDEFKLARHFYKVIINLEARSHGQVVKAEGREIVGSNPSIV